MYIGYMTLKRSAKGLRHSRKTQRVGSNWTLDAKTFNCKEAPWLLISIIFVGECDWLAVNSAWNGCIVSLHRVVFMANHSSIDSCCTTHFNLWMSPNIKIIYQDLQLPRTSKPSEQAAWNSPKPLKSTVWSWVLPGQIQVRSGLITYVHQGAFANWSPCAYNCFFNKVNSLLLSAPLKRMGPKGGAEGSVGIKESGDALETRLLPTVKLELCR